MLYPASTSSSANQTFATLEDGPNTPATLRALFAFSKPTRLSVDLGEKARIFEKVTSNLKEQFKLDKEQVVGLTAVNLEGTQLENFTPLQPPSLDITVAVKLVSFAYVNTTIIKAPLGCG